MAAQIQRQKADDRPTTRCARRGNPAYHGRTILRDLLRLFALECRLNARLWLNRSIRSALRNEVRNVVLTAYSLTDKFQESKGCHITIVRRGLSSDARCNTPADLVSAG